MLKLQCVKHPRYDGSKSPRASCEACAFLSGVYIEAYTRRVRINPRKKKEEIPNELRQTAGG